MHLFNFMTIFDSYKQHQVPKKMQSGKECLDFPQLSSQALVQFFGTKITTQEEMVEKFYLEVFSTFHISQFRNVIKSFVQMDNESFL